MPQYARPSQDIANPGNFTDQSGGSSNLYQAINEASPSDAEYIQSPETPSNAVYVTKLSAVVDPQSSSGHIMRMRTSVSVDGQAPIDIVQELRQGYVNESSRGTLIAYQSRTGITSTTWTTSTYTLSAAEADAITDYSNLYYRFIVNQP